MVAHQLRAARVKRIAIATFGRADYSTCLPIMRAIREDAGLTLQVLAPAPHPSAMGWVAAALEADGFSIDERVVMPMSSDTPEAFAASVGAATTGIARGLCRLRPHILLIVGDRLELLAAATAALACRLPLAHVSGGDVTEGALDNQVRHAVTKMSHVHFVAMQDHADRLLRMGEESWRVHVTGDPALDALRTSTFMTRRELGEHLGVSLDRPVFLATYHPTTLAETDVATEIDAFLAALAQVRGTIIMTHPNADPGHGVIIDRLRRFANERPNVRVFDSLGQTTYYSAMAAADLLVGNSSSAIWEAPTLELPAVDVGERQRGRHRVANVVHTACNTHAILHAIAGALRPEFRAGLRGLRNPYGDGYAAPRVVGGLKNLELGTALLQKSFDDYVLRR
jgi:UDP-hydrolysing UDP-N-acetyl-D-glucosamine 2-epimerase